MAVVEHGFFARPVQAPFRLEALEPGGALEGGERRVAEAGVADVGGGGGGDAWGVGEVAVFAEEDVLPELGGGVGGGEARGAEAVEVDLLTDFVGEAGEEGGGGLVGGGCFEGGW